MTHDFPCPHCGATDGWEAWMVEPDNAFDRTGNHARMRPVSFGCLPLVDSWGWERAMLRQSLFVTLFDRCKACGEAIC